METTHVKVHPNDGHADMWAESVSTILGSSDRKCDVTLIEQSCRKEHSIVQSAFIMTRSGKNLEVKAC